MYRLGRSLGQLAARVDRALNLGPLAKRFAESGTGRWCARLVAKTWFWPVLMSTAWLAFGPLGFWARVAVLAGAVILWSDRIRGAAGRIFSAMDRPIHIIPPSDEPIRRRSRGRRSPTGQRAGKALGRAIGKGIMAIVRQPRRSTRNVWKGWGG